MGEEAWGPPPKSGRCACDQRACMCACVCVRGGMSGTGARTEAVLMYWSEPERMRSEELVARQWWDGGSWGGFPPPQLPGRTDVETFSFSMFPSFCEIQAR